MASIEHFATKLTYHMDLTRDFHGFYMLIAMWKLGTGRRGGPVPACAMQPVTALAMTVDTTLTVPGFLFTITGV